jgi:hypothetical protein
MEDDEASRISLLSSAPSSSAAMYSLASQDEACCEEKARVGEVNGKGRCARVRLNRSNTRDGHYGRSATLSSWKCDHPAECSEGSEGSEG